MIYPSRLELIWTLICKYNIFNVLFIRNFSWYKYKDRPTLEKYDVHWVIILKGAVILHHIDVEMSNIFATCWGDTSRNPPPGTLPPCLNPLEVDTYGNFSVIFHEIVSNFLSVWREVIYIIYQTGFIMWLSDHPRKLKYRWRGRILKEIFCYFSLPASPPTLLMLESPNLYAWYPYAYRWWQRIWNFSVFQFWHNSDFSDFTQKCNFSVNYYWNCLKICKCMGGGGSHINHV